MPLFYKDEAYAIVGACFEVYNELGSGFLEAVYQEALGLEFHNRKIPFVEHPKLEIHYKGHRLCQHYEPDFIAYSKIIIEIKAIKALDDVHRAQLHNYLKATSFKLGLLINFADPRKLVHERVVN